MVRRGGGGLKFLFAACLIQMYVCVYSYPSFALVLSFNSFIVFLLVRASRRSLDPVPRSRRCSCFLSLVPSNSTLIL